jgi:large subunit ribosomal protein L19
MKRGHDVNPRGVLREVEQEEIRRLRAKQEQVDHFKPGDHIAVKLYAEALGKPKLKVVSGICIRRHNNGLGSTFTLRTFSEHKSIEFTYPLFSPWLIAIKLLKKGDVRLAQAYYLRSLEENAYLTRVPDDFLELSPELKAKYEQEKVAAAAAAAARDPTIKAAAAPTTSGGGGASAGKAAAAPKQDKKK